MSGRFYYVAPRAGLEFRPWRNLGKALDLRNLVVNPAVGGTPPIELIHQKPFNSAFFNPTLQSHGFAPVHTWSVPDESPWTGKALGCL